MAATKCMACNAVVDGCFFHVPRGWSSLNLVGRATKVARAYKFVGMDLDNVV